MSTPQEYQRLREVYDDLRAELALVSEQHAAACAKYDSLREHLGNYADQLLAIDYRGPRPAEHYIGSDLLTMLVNA